MRKISIRATGLIMAFLATICGAQDLIQSQPSIWSAKPTAAMFEKAENDRLNAAQRAVDKIVAVKGPRTVDNPLANYDEAMKQLNSAVYFSRLMEAVQPDAAC